MSYREFEAIFDWILFRTPLPSGDKWDLQRLGNAGLQNKQDWPELLYRTCGSYQCNHGHLWNSSWTMILFRFHRDVNTHRVRVRIKRFGQRCNKCTNDNTYHVGFCSIEEASWMVECVLYIILQRCYERRPESDVDDAYYIIPVTNVPRGRFGGARHQRPFCEACAHDRCQEKYKELTKKK